MRSRWGWRNALIAAAIALAVVRLYACITFLLLIPIVNVVGRTDQAKMAKVKQDFASIQIAAGMFRNDHGRWPESLEELLNPPPEPGSGRRLEYLSGQPLDPWTHELYRFERTEEGLVLHSFGDDRAPGGEGTAADIVVRP